MPITTEDFIAVLRDETALLEEEGLWPRQIACPLIPGKATTLIGIRRAGKSTLMRQVAMQWRTEGLISTEQILSINFSDERLFGVEAQDLTHLIEAHYQLHPALPRETGLTFLLDEIQLITGWERFVDRLLRNKRHRVLVSGSSAKLLSTEIATELRGRSLTQEVFPLSFSEYLQVHGSSDTTPGESERGKRAHFARLYLEQGGFPEIQKLSPPLQRKVLQEYLHLVFAKDLVERHNPRDPHALRTVLHLGLSSVSAPCTFTKLSKRLKSSGISATPSEVGTYLSWAQDCYLLFLLPIFAQSEHKKNTNPRKLYCCDNGLITLTNIGITPKLGTQLENAVFLSLRQKHSELFYYKTDDGKEVDFAFLDTHGKVALVQASLSLKEHSTRETEIRALVSACKECGTQEGCIVTVDEKEEFIEEGISVRVEPFHSFALGNQS